MEAEEDVEETAARNTEDRNTTRPEFQSSFPGHSQSFVSLTNCFHERPILPFLLLSTSSSSSAVDISTRGGGISRTCLIVAKDADED